MKYVFTKHKLVDVIVWGLEEPCSHIGIVFHDKFVFHSSPRNGVEVMSMNDFQKSRKIVFEVEVPMPESTETKLLNQAKLKDAGYDFKYFWYLFKSALMLKLFRKEISHKVGKYDSPSSYICHEIYELLPKKYRPTGDLFTASTPYRVYMILKGNS